MNIKISSLIVAIGNKTVSREEFLTIIGQFWGNDPEINTRCIQAWHDALENKLITEEDIPEERRLDVRNYDSEKGMPVFLVDDPVVKVPKGKPHYKSLKPVDQDPETYEIITRQDQDAKDAADTVKREKNGR